MSTRTTRAAARASTGDDSRDAAKPKSTKAQQDEGLSKGTKTTTPAKANISRKRKASTDNSPEVKTEAATPSKRTRKTPVKSAKPTSKATPKTTSKSKSKGKATPSEADLEGGAKMASAWMKVRDDQFAEGAAPTSPAKKSKANPYNLTPGASPYPTFPYPTATDCQHVNDVLAKIHGSISAPKTVPVPSLNSSGCGEVPSVLDALIRTRLSAATNGANSSRAFRGLVEKFGVIKEGVGKGSVNWDKVRTADQSDVFEAIRSGGLADVKSRDIKKILQLVYEENQARKAELQKSDRTNSNQGFKEKNEIERAEAGVVSLDHLHELSSEDAFNKLLQYPGIGPKTASCVLLFCMQRPSFAVDTHVFRLTRWLGWTPSDAELRRLAKDAKADGSAAAMKSEDGEAGAKVKDEEAVEGDVKPMTPGKSPAKRVRGPPPVTRNSTYSHLDVRIPDELKYPLHYLLIKHGKSCPECSAKKDRSVVEKWGGKACPLKRLKRAAKSRARGGAVKDEEEEDVEEDGQEEEVDDEEEGESVKDEEEEDDE